MVEGVPVCGVRSAFPDWHDVVVVFEAAAYGWEVEADGDGMFYDFRLGSDPGEEEQFGAADGTRRENYL